MLDRLRLIPAEKDTVITGQIMEVVIFSQRVEDPANLNMQQRQLVNLMANVTEKCVCTHTRDNVIFLLKTPLQLNPQPSFLRGQQRNPPSPMNPWSRSGHC